MFGAFEVAGSLLKREFRAIDFRHPRSEEHTSELQSQSNLVCRLLLEKKNKNNSFSFGLKGSITFYATILDRRYTFDDLHLNSHAEHRFLNLSTVCLTAYTTTYQHPTL